MREPAQIQAMSIIGVLDAAFRLYRAQFRDVLSALVAVLGTMIVFFFMVQVGSHVAIDWVRLSPLRPEALLDLLDDLRFGSDLFDSVWRYLGNLLLLVLTQTLLTGAVISVVARAYLAPFHVTVWARPRGLRGEVVLLPGVLAALPLSLLGALIARRVLGMALLLWVPDEPLDLGLLQFVSLNGGPELLACLALAALSVRLLFAAPAAMLDPPPARGSLRRSWRLTRGAFGRVAVAALLVTLVPALLIGSLPLIPYAVVKLTAALDLYASLLMVTTLLGQALLALAYTFQLTFLTLLYYDLRFRGEGLDLMLLANQGAAEQARKLYASGTARQEHGDLAGALADFEQARLLLPNDRTVLSACIGVLLRLGDSPEALKTCEHAVTRFPDDPYLLHCRGLVRFQLGDVDGGQADYDRALRLYPNQATALLNRAHVKHAIGAYDSAREDLLELLRLKPGVAAAIYNPGATAAMYNIACGYARQSQPDAALDWLHQAITKDKRYRALAREDADFTALRADPRCLALLGEAAESRS